MAPKRYYAPLVALCVAGVLLISLSYSVLRPGFIPSSDSDLITNRSRNQDRNPNFSFIIKLLAYDRFESISRCLNSLSNAQYGSDTVHLHVYIDHFSFGDLGKADSDVDARLRNARRIVDFVDGFEWRFGEKVVHYRTANAGLQGQWLEAWWPSSDDEFAFVVEDDLEVSPMYYKFLKRVIEHYNYNQSNYSPWIYGASLQRPRFVPGKHGNKLQLSGDTRLFLYQLVGTWGQLLFPRPWKEFRLWYDLHKVKGMRPFLQGMVTNGWYKKMGERIWTPWFIKFVQSRSYFNIYTNFQNERALSVSHRDTGVNYGKSAGPDSKLLDEKSLDFDLLEMKSLNALKWYDFCFREVVPGRIIRSDTELGSVISSVQEQESVIFVSISRVPENVIKNLLCHFEKQNIQNFILMGSDSDVLLDLARRGHPVADVNQLFDSIRRDKSVDIKASPVDLLQEILVKASVVRKCVESNLNSWVVDANVLFNSSEWYSELVASSPNVLAGRTSELFFIRSSSSSKKIFDKKFMNGVAAMVNSLGSKNASSTDEGSFSNVMVSLLDRKGVKVTRIDEATAGRRVDLHTVSQKSMAVRDSMFLWPSKSDYSVIQKNLEELGLWIIDGDSSCMAVYCHQS